MQIANAARTFPEHIHSAGVDLVDLCRWERAMERCGDALAQRYFTAEERRTARERATEGRSAADILGHLFGVKESVVKMAGGLPPTARLADICVEIPEGTWDRRPWPVRLSGALADWACARRVDVVASSGPLTDRMTLAWAAARTLDTPS
ncbi:phosphopantetheine--protein transferase-like protein [Streptomyces griseochromogenes]|uniref:Phosphopantetheine--protein transferase-like protein n=1 Tax=Streptomyces griseochromogenes TaxID=68214 RepID=A0ABS4M7I9_9ACTN|nr:4'-phosphopantetheinyl transferase superfamily protein [Streptomyces griseochromogenes]MBP2055642.1 phosphopantetheine--protein transferase-like protein [Streptomyces griseochromogenes]